MSQLACLLGCRRCDTSWIVEVVEVEVEEGGGGKSARWCMRVGVEVA